MTPIALFVYNRPDHTRKTLEALAQNDGAKETKLYIFSDFFNTDEVHQVRQLIHQPYNFAEIEIIERPQKFGLAHNIIDGINYIFQTHDQVIALEDDLITSPYLINYFNQTLDFYKHKNIFSIAAYSPNINIPSDYIFSTYAIPRNCSWGWATWKDRWQQVDWQVTDFQQFIHDKTAQQKFNQAGNDLTPMLLKQQLGEINSWSIRFCYSAFRSGMMTIYPTQSLIANCGIDGTGTNTRKTQKYETPIASFIDTSNLLPEPIVDEKILRAFRKFYNTSFIRKFINFLKILRYESSHPKS